jgi:hypothetical protein
LRFTPTPPQATGRSPAAIDRAFQPAGPQENQVLFRLPVTQDWLEQLVLSLTLMCPSSYRGGMELLETMFDYRQISLGSIHNLLRQAVDKARQFHSTEELSAIRVGAHDGIYQARQPVLVGRDVVSTYCYDNSAWRVDTVSQPADRRRSCADGDQTMAAGSGGGTDRGR